MRLTAEESRPLRGHLIVLFNGEEMDQSNLSAADEEAGTIQRYLRDAQGGYYLDETGQAAASEILTGCVAILLKPTAPAKARRYFMARTHGAFAEQTRCHHEF